MNINAGIYPWFLVPSMKCSRLYLDSVGVTIERKKKLVSNNISNESTHTRRTYGYLAPSKRASSCRFWESFCLSLFNIGDESPCLGMGGGISFCLPAGKRCGFRWDMSNREMGLRKGWKELVRNGSCSSAVVDLVGDEKVST